MSCRQKWPSSVILMVLAAVNKDCVVGIFRSRISVRPPWICMWRFSVFSSYFSSQEVLFIFLDAIEFISEPLHIPYCIYRVS